MRRASGVALCAGAVSLGLHASGLVAFAPERPQALAGGPQQLAMVGNSFEDAVAGRIAPSETTAETEPPDVSDRLEPVTAVTPTTARIEPAPVRATAPAVATASQTRPAEPAPRVTAMSPVTDTVTAPVVPGLPRVAPTTSETAQTPPAEPPSASPSPQPRRIAARPEPTARTPDADTPRPLARAPRPERTAERPPEPPPAPAGSAEQTTRAGTAAGQARGNAAQTAQGGTAQSASDGRAAANYPQVVNRRLSRLRRPNARFNGAAVIAFTIAPGGGFAALSVARSSGSAEFDRFALSHVQRAAPFPAPPPGAQRSFNVTVQGR